METRDIYELRYSYKKQERPIVDFSLPENGRKVSWSLIGQILEDKAPTGLYKPVHLVVKEANATEWDTYSAAGTYGLMSQRAVALVGDSMTLCFEFLEAYINEAPYFLLKPTGHLDCLDYDKSDIVYWDIDPYNIKTIKHCSFHKQQIPEAIVFRLPDWHGLFATAPIKAMIDKAGLKGFCFFDTE